MYQNLYPLFLSCVHAFASYFLFCSASLAVNQSVCLFAVCLAVCQSVCILFSHLLGCLNLSICPVSLCLVSQLSSLVWLISSHCLLSVSVQIQAFNVQSDKFASASDCATFLTPAILMGLVTSLILLLVLAYALHMVVHLKHIDRYEEHKATVYFPRSPEAELPDKNSLWRKKKSWRMMVGERGREKAEKQSEGGECKWIQEWKSILRRIFVQQHFHFAC